jgi:hypothetical protein
MNEKFDLKNPAPDDPSVSQANSNAATGDGKSEDWGMTNPLSPQPEQFGKDGWKMPEPVFRKTAGYSPLKSGQSESVSTSSKKPPEPTDEKLSNLYAPPAPEADLPDLTLHNINLSDLKASMEKEAIAHNQSIEPPPQISENLSAPESAPPIAVQEKTKSPTRRLIFAALGILAMVIFAAAFLGLVYYLYIFRAGTE